MFTYLETSNPTRQNIYISFEIPPGSRFIFSVDGRDVLNLICCYKSVLDVYL